MSVEYLPNVCRISDNCVRLHSMPVESMYRFRTGTTFVHMNVCSLLPKLKELRIFLKNTNIQVLSINESWLCEDIEDSEIAISGYTIFRRDRPNGCR